MKKGKANTQVDKGNPRVMSLLQIPRTTGQIGAGPKVVGETSGRRN